MSRNKLSALAFMLLLLLPALLPLQAAAQTVPVLRDPGSPLPATGDVNGLQALIAESEIRVSPGYTVRNALGLPVTTFTAPPPPLAPVAMRASAPRLPSAEAPRFVEFDLESEADAASGPLIHSLSIAALPGSIPPLAPPVAQDANALEPQEYRVERVALPILLPGDYAANLTVLQKSPDGSLAPLTSLDFPIHVEAPRLEGDGRDYVRVVDERGAVVANASYAVEADAGLVRVTVGAESIGHRVRIVQPWVESRLGAAGLDHPHRLVHALNGTWIEYDVTTGSLSVTFRAIELGASDSPTVGSRHQILLGERAMAVRILSRPGDLEAPRAVATPNGTVAEQRPHLVDRLAVDFRGSHEGQPVAYNETWLRGLGFANPYFVHEDGTRLNATLHDGHYVVDVPHFSVVYTFDSNDEAFTKLASQPNSEIAWSATDRRINLVSDRRDAADEIVGRALPTRLTTASSWTVTSRFGTSQQGNWQGSFPLVLSAGTPRSDVSTTPGTVGFYYYSRDSNLAQNPEYHLTYRDAGGVLRLSQPFFVGRLLEIQLQAQFDAPTSTLTLRILDQWGTPYAGMSASYKIGTNANDGFNMDTISVASDGWSGGSEPGVIGWVDDIRVSVATSTTISDDDGTAEDSLHLNSGDDTAIKYLNVPTGFTSGASSATLRFQTAVGQCPGGEVVDLYVRDQHVQRFNPCSLWPAATNGATWVSYPLTPTWFADGVLNKVQLIDRSSYWDTNLYMGLDQHSTAGRTTAIQDYQTKSGELMWRLDVAYASNSACFTASPTEGNRGTTFTLDATCSRLNAPNAGGSYRWDYDGNGVWDTGWLASSSTTWNYASVGTYPAKLELRTSSDARTLATQTLKVLNRAPGVTASASTTNPIAGDPVTFTARYSDVDGDEAQQVLLVLGGRSYLMSRASTRETALAGQTWHVTVPVAAGSSWYVQARDVLGGVTNTGTAWLTTQSKNIYYDGFEGAGAWTPSGQWRTVETGTTHGRVFQGTRAYWFGNPNSGTYATTDGTVPTGSLVSGFVNLGSAPTGVQLTFMSWHQTESDPQYDLKLVQVQRYADRFTTKWDTVLKVEGGADREKWGMRSAPLAAYAGDSIRVRFHFDARDAMYNDHRGWYVDNVAIGIDRDEDMVPDHIEDTIALNMTTPIRSPRPIQETDPTVLTFPAIKRMNVKEALLHLEINHPDWKQLAIDVSPQGGTPCSLWPRSGQEHVGAYHVEFNLKTMCGYSTSMFETPRNWRLAVMDMRQDNVKGSLLSATLNVYGKLDSAKRDTDGDNVDDGRELLGVASSPLTADIDNDQLPDGVDARPWIDDLPPRIFDVRGVNGNAANGIEFSFEDNYAVAPNTMHAIAGYNGGSAPRLNCAQVADNRWACTGAVNAEYYLIYAEDANGNDIEIRITTEGQGFREIKATAAMVGLAGVVNHGSKATAFTRFGGPVAYVGAGLVVVGLASLLPEMVFESSIGPVRHNIKSPSIGHLGSVAVSGVTYDLYKDNWRKINEKHPGAWSDSTSFLQHVQNAAKFATRNEAITLRHNGWIEIVWTAAGTIVGVDRYQLPPPEGLPRDNVKPMEEWLAIYLAMIALVVGPSNIWEYPPVAPPEGDRDDPEWISVTLARSPNAAREERHEITKLPMAKGWRELYRAQKAALTVAQKDAHELGMAAFTERRLADWLGNETDASSSKNVIVRNLGMEWYWGTPQTCTGTSVLRRCALPLAAQATNHGAGSDAWRAVRVPWSRGTLADAWGIAQTDDLGGLVDAWKQAQSRARTASSATSTTPAVAIVISLDYAVPEVTVEPRSTPAEFAWG